MTTRPTRTEVLVRSSPGQLFVCLRPHLSALDRFLRAQLDCFEPEIRELVEYCVDITGKRIRPSLVFFSGWGGSDEVRPALVRAAAIVELVHLATLVHDDIMDGAELRRNRPTAARRFGGDAAVLLGDALLAHAVHLAAEYPSTEVCRVVARATRLVCAGEITQTLRRGDISITMADYRRIIDLKTAELFRVSCFLGSRLAGLDTGFVKAASVFGRRLGIAYQIYDDLADFFGEEKRIGKTLGTDLAGGKLTLPLLVLLKRLPKPDRAELLEEIRARRPPQYQHHLAQMNGHGVFATVASDIHAELKIAKAALESWSKVEAGRLLGQLIEMLREQVENLRQSAIS